MDLNLDGRVAVVTGAGSGIGLATCRRLVEEGAIVVGADVAPEAISELGPKDKVLAVKVDLGTDEGPAATIERAKQAFGGVDILINCIGVATVREGFLSVTDKDLAKTLDVNFLSMLRTCRATIPVMIERGGGAIVSVASDAGRMPDPFFFFDYSLSKAAILMFSKTISIEFGPKRIRSNVVSPGPTRTPAWDKPGGFADSLASLFGLEREAAIERFVNEVRKLPLGRMGAPDEIASVCVFLASDRAGFMTGANYAVDGGSIPVV